MDRADEEWFRNFLRGEFEKIGINANSDTSRERTRSNFALTDGMNNDRTKEAIEFIRILNIPRNREALEDLIERYYERGSRTKEIQKGLFGSFGEWMGRLITGAIGAGFAWWTLRH